jgi:hypothetical protein
VGLNLRNSLCSGRSGEEALGKRSYTQSSTFAYGCLRVHGELLRHALDGTESELVVSSEQPLMVVVDWS